MNLEVNWKPVKGSQNWENVFFFCLCRLKTEMQDCVPIANEQFKSDLFEHEEHCSNQD